MFGEHEASSTVDPMLSDFIKSKFAVQVKSNAKKNGRIMLELWRDILAEKCVWKRTQNRKLFYKQKKSNVE